MTEEQFVESYNKLCRESGYALQAQVGLKQQIDGTFTIGSQLAVVKINQPGILNAQQADGKN